MVLNEARQDFEHYFELSLDDGLNHEALVMRQEEEAATLTRPFTSLEHLVTIELRQKALLQHAKRHLIGIKQGAELVKFMVGDVGFSRDSCDVVLGVICLLIVAEMR